MAYEHIYSGSTFGRNRNKIRSMFGDLFTASTAVDAEVAANTASIVTLDADAITQDASILAVEQEVDALNIATVAVPIEVSMYHALPAFGAEHQWNGGLLALATAQPLDAVPTDLPVTKGTGKLLIVVNAGTDLAGDITVTGDTVDRDTGAVTIADTEVITVDALTVESSVTDSNGNIAYVFTGAYITSKWFTGSVVLSTADLTLTDVDVYHTSFSQFNDSPNMIINTFDVSLNTSNVAAQFDAYLQTVHVTGSKCNIHNEAELHVGTDGQTAIADKYWRLRQGSIDEALDGTTDGYWVELHYSNSPSYITDVTAKLWATKTVGLTIV